VNDSLIPWLARRVLCEENSDQLSEEVEDPLE
jgi:hypothetical protein